MPVLNLNDDAAVAKYNAFIRQSPNAQISQDLGWAKVKNNWEPCYVYLEDAAGNITAALSMLLTMTPSGKKFAYASKGPVMDMSDLATFDQLIATAKQALGDDAYLLRLDPEVRYDAQFEADLRAHGYEVRGRNVAEQGMHATIQPRLNMVIDFANYPDATSLYDMVPSKTKNKLRKPEREGVVVDYGLDQSFLDDFFETYVIMSNRHGITHRPKDYFERMMQTYAGTDIMRIYRAKKDDVLLATTIGFKMGDKIWDMYAGSIDHDLTNAHYATRVHMVQWALDAGLKRYDIGGIDHADNTDGLYKFKRNFVRQDPTEYIGEIDVVLDDAIYDELVRQPDQHH
ncbi:lipid II:glycine glycyltransferase FemX [Weissella sp. MSCH1]|uniref:UDP-N-acetylmuramoylpentapeptide-lysine N(6)-alanyltransferase n=1 Tax=Weissella sp. MSCH1 TaxID=3383343 RepID=UPI003896E7FA